LKNKILNQYNTYRIPLYYKYQSKKRLIDAGLEITTAVVDLIVVLLEESYPVDENL
jgi:hypothetical protein